MFDFTRKIAAHVQQELDSAREARSIGHYASEFSHLENFLLNKFHKDMDN